MAFHTPPEVLLRQCIRVGSLLTKTVRPHTLSPRKCSTTSYKAAVVTKFGQPFEMQQMQLPQNLESNEVLLSIHGCGVNFADILSSKGQYQMKIDPPFTPGNEISGKVVDVGSDVSNVKTGDRVLGLLPKAMGGAAEFCVTDSSMLIPVPDNLSLVEAAATVVNYGTAMLAISRKANLKKGETVLVTAAAGGTGLAIMDIARNLFECEVIAVCGGQEKCCFVKEHGASQAIDYKTENIRQKVKQFTGGQGVNVVFDQVGGDGFLDCIKSLAFEGRAVTIGYASGKIPQIPANILLLKSASLVGVWWGNYAMSHPPAFFESITSVMQAISQGKLRPFVGKTFPLDQTNEAFQYIVDRKNTGKVVIKVKEEDHISQ